MNEIELKYKEETDKLKKLQLLLIEEIINTGNESLLNHYLKFQQQIITCNDSYNEWIKDTLKSEYEELILSHTKDCRTCKHIKVSKYVEPCYGCIIDDTYLNYENISIR